MTEWVSFRDNLPSGLVVGLCGSIAGEVVSSPTIPNPNICPPQTTWIVPVGVTSISAVAV